LGGGVAWEKRKKVAVRRKERKERKKERKKPREGANLIFIFLSSLKTRGENQANNCSITISSREVHFHNEYIWKKS
jgi:hypothetical protein